MNCDPNGVRDNVGGVNDIAFLVSTLIGNTVTLVVIVWNWLSAGLN